MIKKTCRKCQAEVILGEDPMFTIEEERYIMEDKDGILCWKCIAEEDEGDENDPEFIAWNDEQNRRSREDMETMHLMPDGNIITEDDNGREYISRLIHPHTMHLMPNEKKMAKAKAISILNRAAGTWRDAIADMPDEVYICEGAVERSIKYNQHLEHIFGDIINGITGEVVCWWD